jgi:hypothetical protein
MQTDYPELRAWLENNDYQNAMQKNIYLCSIKDKEAYTALQMLNFNNKIQPSLIIVVMPDGSYKDFWLDVYQDEKNIPYEFRLPTYSEYFLVY